MHAPCRPRPDAPPCPTLPLPAAPRTLPRCPSTSGEALWATWGTTSRQSAAGAGNNTQRRRSWAAPPRRRRRLGWPPMPLSSWRTNCWRWIITRVGGCTVAGGFVLRCRGRGLLRFAVPAWQHAARPLCWRREPLCSCPHCLPLPSGIPRLSDAADAVYVLALHERGCASSQAEAEQWVTCTADRVRALAATQQAHGAGAGAQPGQPNGAASAPAAVRGAVEQPPANGVQQQAAEAPSAKVPPPFRLREGRRRYLANVTACQRALHDGESYEVCLTTQLCRRGAPDAAALYRTLRRVNPAPYAGSGRAGGGVDTTGVTRTQRLRSGAAGCCLPWTGHQPCCRDATACRPSCHPLLTASTCPHAAAAWLRFGAGDLQLCCCSPERFLRGDRGGQLEAKPIKGTAPRCPEDPAADAAAAAALASACWARGARAASRAGLRANPGVTALQHFPVPSRPSYFPLVVSPCHCFTCSFGEGPGRKPDDC